MLGVVVDDFYHTVPAVGNVHVVPEDVARSPHFPVVGVVVFVDPGTDVQNISPSVNQGLKNI